MAGAVGARGGMPAPVVLAGALGVSVAADWLDQRLFDGGGVLLSTGFLLACVLAVVTVRSRGVALVMMTTPLVLVVAVLVAALAFTRGGIDNTGRVLAMVQPMVLHFPVMAGTTVLVLIVGGTRLILDHRASRSAAEQLQNS